MNTFLKTLGRLLLPCCMLLMMMPARATQLSSSVTYTIDPSASATDSTFKNFTSAVAYLTGVGSRTDGGLNNTAPFGVTGPIVFNVAAGTYTERVVITGAIPGASSVNTITFDGGAGNAASRVINYAATASSSRHTFQLNNTQYVRLRNLTFMVSGATYGWALHITGAASDCQVKNCIFNGSSTAAASTSANYSAIVVSGSNTGIDEGTLSNNLEIDSNTITFGRYGIAINGTYDDKGLNNKIRNNTITNAYIRGISINEQRGLIVERNDIGLRTTPPGSSYAIYCSGLHSGTNLRSIVNANRITNNIGTHGIYLNSCNTNDTAVRTLIINNMVGGAHKLATGNGLYLTGTEYISILHNSFDYNGDGTTFTDGAVYLASGCDNIRIVNNIIASSKAGEACALYVTDAGSVDSLDYNVYYKAGVNKSFMYLWGTTYNNSTSFIGAGGFNAHSVWSSPGYLAANNMHIKSACVNGADLSYYTADPLVSSYISNDIDGNPRATNAPDIGADEFISLASDLMVESIAYPLSPALSGLQDLGVVVRNNGNSVITAFSLFYTHNGGTQKLSNWSGTLEACESDTVVFGGMDQVTIGDSNNFTVYAEYPGDMDLTNDTFKTVVRSGLSGNYTIASSGGDYTTVTAAVNALKLRGITGPVTFFVNGTFTEQVSLNAQIAGVSPTNTITFDGTSSGLITFASPASASMHTFMVSSNYVRLRNLTIRGTGSYAWPLHIMGNNLNNIQVKNCVVEITGTGANATNQNFSAMIINAHTSNVNNGGRIDSLEIDSNRFKSGYYGVVCSGLSGQPGNYNKFRNNIIDSTINTSLLIQQQNGVLVQNNTINRRTPASSGEGIRLNNILHNPDFRMILNANKIQQKGGSGIYINSCVASATLNGICTNNSIGGDLTKGSSYGIQINGSAYWTVAHNTVIDNYPDAAGREYSTFTIYGSQHINALNNIFAVTAASAALPVYADNVGTFDTIDYNQYYRADTSNHEFINVGGMFNSGDFIAVASQHSIVKPVRNVSKTDLRLTEGCNDGRDLVTTTSDAEYAAIIAKDADGNTRPSSPDMGAYEFATLPVDLAVTRIVEPLSTDPFAPGLKDLVVRVQNNGSTPVTAFTLKYDNNGTIVSESWTGSLDPCTDTAITFTGSNQLDLSVASNLKVYTELSGDAYAMNDTLKATYVPGLSGPYTIGATGDYTSFSAAVNALKLGGVLGPVTFTVDAGTYAEQVNLNEQIRGASATNTITFDGVDSSDRILDYTAGASATRYTLWIGSGYVRFKNLTIRASGTQYGWPVYMHHKNGLNNVQVTNCVIDITSPAGMAATNENFMGLVVSSSTSSASNESKLDSLVVDRNRFNYGYGAIVMYGLYDEWNYSLDGRITNNIFYNQAGSGMEITKHVNLHVENNLIQINKTTNNGSGISLSEVLSTGPGRTVVAGNTISSIGSNGNGVSLFKCTSNTGTKGILANNMISGFKNVNGVGISINQSNNWYVCHNSVNKDISGGSSNTEGSAFIVNDFSSAPANITVFNNIFAVSKTSASLPVVTTNSTSLFDTLDYNIYYKSDTSNGQLLNIYSNVYSPSNFIGGGGWNVHSMFRSSNFISDSNLHLPPQNSCANRYGFGTLNPELLAYISTDIDGDVRVNPPMIGADEISAPYANDLAITELITPAMPLSAGLFDIMVRITNTGSLPVTDAMVAYTINNSAPVTQPWTGSINQCDTSSVLVGIQVPINTGENVIQVYTVSVNNMTDENTTNDTLTIVLNTAMSGVYTIGSEPTDSFTNFTEAMSALYTRGVDGRVQFDVRAGIYNEGLEFTPIPGSSATNYVVFQAQHRDSVSIAYTSNAAKQSAITFLNASYITFRNIGIDQQNTTDYNGLTLSGNCSADTFDNCRISAFTTTGLNYALYASNIVGSGLVFTNNLIFGGGGGIYVRGISSQPYTNVVFDRNSVQATFFATFDIRDLDSLLFTNNTISLNGNRQENNNYVLACSHSLFANNIITGTDFVNEPLIQLFSNSTASAIYHNSFNLKTDNGNGVYIFNDAGSSIKVRNNVFATRGTGYAATFNSQPGSNTDVDYNSYSASGDLLRQLNPNRTYGNLTAWKTQTGQDLNSVSYRPGFTSNTDVTPDAADSASWSLNGRAKHNDLDMSVYGASVVLLDINGQVRPATYADGTPDIGAIEFTPTSVPPAASAVPASPVAGITQVFVFAHDTVEKITWDASSAVPSYITVRQYSGVKPPAIANNGDYMYFYINHDIEPGTYTYDVEIPYKEGWRGILPMEADARLTMMNASIPWSIDFATTVDSTLNKFNGRLTGDWTLITGTNMNNPIPVKLISFSAEKVKQNVNLNWVTASESNNKGFLVERSTDGRNFEAIGFVKGNGNTNVGSKYQFTDAGAFAKASVAVLYYRLKQTDHDGRFSYTSVVSVSNEVSQKQLAAYPNPFNGELNIQVQSPVEGLATVAIMDLTGKQTGVKLSHNVVAGTNVLTIQADQLGSGVYFLSVDINGEKQIIKLIKQ